jgi:tellurium resistance protein TerD
MKISVESGERTPFAFENSKIKVEGSSGLFHNGNISISKDNKVIYAGEANNKTSSTQAKTNVSSGSSNQATNLRSQSSQTNTTVKTTKKSLLSLGVDSSLVKKLNSGQKMSISDFGISDNKLVIGVDLEYIANEFEVDFSMFLIDESGKSSEENFIFYGNKVSKNQEVTLDNDLGLSVSGAFDSVMSVDLNKVASSIKRISLAATLYDPSNKFGDLKNGVIRLVSTSKKETLSFNFTEKLDRENAIVICDLYLHNGNWKIQGIGQGFNGGLEALCKNFGIDTM